MTLPNRIVWFDLHQLLGADFDPRRTKAYVTTNVENGTLIDTTTGEIRMGDQAVTINADGTGEFVTWVPNGADGNPATWQTYFHVDHPRTGQRDRKTRTFGPYTINAVGRVVTNKSLTSNVATLTVSEPHGLRVGDDAGVTGVDATFNGYHTITAVPSPTSLSYAKTAADVPSTTSSGIVDSTYVSLALLEEEQVAAPTRTAQDSADEAAVSATAAQTARTGSETARTGAETARADAEAARDATVDISGISTSDSVVEALVKNTGGAGPLTSAALSATFAEQQIVVKSATAPVDTSKVWVNTAQELVVPTSAFVDLQGTVALPSGVVTKVPFTTVSHDDQSYWDAANYWFVVPVTGKYRVTCEVGFGSHATGRRIVEIFSSRGNRKYASNEFPPSAGGPTFMQAVLGPRTFTVGDTIWVTAYQNSGVSLNYQTLTTWFSIERVV